MNQINSIFRTPNRRIAAFALIILFFDQLTKALVLRFLGYEQEKVVIDGFFKFVHWGNTGAAWSMFRGNNGMLAIVAIVVIGAALLLRQPPASGGSIGDVFAVDVPNQNLVLCTMQMTVENHTKKELVIRGLAATLHSDQGDLDDTAAPAPDFQRYLESFPDLKPHTLDPLRPETKIPVGGSVTGSIIVAFPVSREKFDARKGISATVQLYDFTDLKLTK